MKRVTQAGIVTLLLTSFAAPVMAHEDGQWIFRAGVGQVAPKSGNLSEPIALEVDNGTSLTLNGTYMFTSNWAFDILGAWPFKHDVKAGDTTIAEVEHLPPTFSLQYHFLPDSQFQPYAGLGLNYTTFISEDFVVEGIGDSLSLDDSFGVAAQLGADWTFNEKWLLNFDVRWINIESDLSIDGAPIGTVEIDPWVYSLNVGYRF